MKQKTKLTVWLVVGIILALGPIWGMVGTVIGMVMAFGHMQQGGTAELANDISIALYTTAAGYIACPIGIVIIIVAAIKLNRTKNEAG